MMFKTNCFFTMFSAAIGLLSFSSAVHGQAATAKVADDQTEIVRVYDVSDLVDPQPNLLGDWLTGESQATVTGLGGVGGQSVGFGGGQGGMNMMGGGGQGGGFMSVPSHIQPQFGGGGFMGDMGGGLGSVSPHATGMLELTDLLAQFNIGSAEYSYFGKLLVANATERGHQQIDAVLKALREKLLATPTMEIAMRLITVDPAMAIKTDNLTPDQLSQLANSKDAISVTLRCGNGRTGSIASGARKSFVISATPVVGSDGLGSSSSEKSIGYSPRVITPMIGLIGKVRPVLAETPVGQPRRARIDMGIVYSVGSDEVNSATYGTGQTIDRIDVRAAEFQSQVSVQESQWTLAGLTSMTDGTASLMAVIVRWQEAK